jgi:hypothetical protein
MLIAIAFIAFFLMLVAWVMAPSAETTAVAEKSSDRKESLVPSLQA